MIFAGADDGFGTVKRAAPEVETQGVDDITSATASKSIV
jgi:hypothetical protein